MYNQPPSGSPRDIPEGYGGYAFREEVPPSEGAPCEEEHEMQEQPAAVRAGGRGRGGAPFPSLLSLFGGGEGLLGRFKVKSLWDGDLLLLVLAVLLFASRDEDCEEEDEHLWLLLLLVFFMK